MTGIRRMRRTGWGLWIVGVLAMSILVGAGCSGSSSTGGATPAAKSEQVTIAVTGGVDKTPVHLDSRVADVVVWSNSGDEPVTIEFTHGGPAALEIPAHGQSRAVAVSEFGGRGSYPYHIRKAGQSMNSAADSSGGPDEPQVDVGP